MIRYVAFLRAINVGGHKGIKMSDLRQMFESIGLARVSTYIQTGNVIFESPESRTERLEDHIEKRLHQALGYEVATFLRTTSEVAAIADYRPFTRTQLADEHRTLYITFLREAPDRQRQRAALALSTEVDEYHFKGRELFTLHDQQAAKSPFSNTLIEKTLGVSATTRNRTTVSKIAKLMTESPHSPS